MTTVIANCLVQEKIYESDNSLVYRARQEEPQRCVIFKMLKHAYPSPEQIAWFRREYELTRSLRQEGIVEAYELTTDQHRPVMVLEDFGGDSLEIHLKRRRRAFTLVEFFPLAIGIVDIIARVHHQQVMHKDVNPSNLVWNPQTGLIKLIDFGISTALAREDPALRNPTVGEGTLAYMSPEQTGRMNRAMDSRTDLYSLGITFYELLTGQVPFPLSDALEIMHAHLARQPHPPDAIVPDIPAPLSTIVLRLMAKNAEDRYQSASGLKADLEECFRQWRETGQVESFPLGQHDMADRFDISQKLYGREAEMSILVSAFERVSQGLSEMVLISGVAGVGKSALVREIYKPITRQRGYVISGKFEQFHKNIPYASLAQAFRSLIKQILTEGEAQVATWRERLLRALGTNSQVMIDIIPDISRLVGSQPLAPLLPSAEAQNRLNLVFQNLVNVFSQAEHPLVLCLDDLQWADLASLNLLRLLMTAPEHRHLLIIGTYRENEVHDTHPLRVLLDEIENAGSRVNPIVLQPLGASDVCRLVAHTLNSMQERVKPLAEMIFAKTQGNPFFVNEFVKALYSEELLTFDFGHGGWQWNVARIQALNITDNVVELMGGKLLRLAPQTQRVVKLAACIGTQFDLHTLAIVCGRSPKETAIDLWEAMKVGIIVPLENAYKLMELDVEGLMNEITADYKFAHDRVQQAAYSLIPDTEKQATHSQIGYLLLRHTPSNERENRIFVIVNQLNLGRELVLLQTRREELAELNLLAGRRAKTAAAYGPALDYFAVGLELVGEDVWERRYDVALALHLETAEAAYLCGDFGRMEELTEVVFQRAKTLLDSVKAYEARLSAYSLQKRQREGIRLGLHILTLLGVALPENPTHAEIFQSLEETQRILAGKATAKLLDLPRMTDPHKLAAIGILVRLYHHAYTGAPELYPLIVSTIVRLSVTYGNTPHSALGYAGYGFVLCAFIGDIETGYQFGQLALRLVEQFNARGVKSGALFIFNAFIRHWKEHIKETLPSLLEAYQIGLETGDLSLGTIAAFDYGFQLYWMGKDIGGLEQELAKYSTAFRQLKQDHLLSVNEMYRQVAANLQGQATDPCRLLGSYYNEESTLPRLMEENDANALTQIYLHKLILCYLFQQYPQCNDHAVLAERYLNGVGGTPAVPAFYLYDSLARLAVILEVQGTDRESHVEKVAANQEKMKNWAQHAPMNYLHKFYLVEAERARVSGNDRDAREYYDQAIDLAKEHEYVNEEALANELAAKFYLARGQTRLAQYYLRDAHYAYQRWGALAKVKDLETRYPQFLAHTDPSFSHSGGGMFTAGTEQRLSSAFDFTSILHASQAISSEMRLDKLLTKLMAFMIENAGAQRGVLILEKDGQLVIEAEKTLDRDEVHTLQSVPVETRKDLPLAILRYVARTKEQVVLPDATQEAGFATDPYLSAVQPKSILCTPLVTQGKLTGLLYLENNLTTGAFTPDRLEVLHLLGAEAAIAIENARLYGSLEETNAQLADYSKTLEQKVEERTRALQEKNRELEAANQQVREANRRKSQFLAGMSHQLRTPMNAILGFTRLVLRRAGELLPARQRDNLGKVKESAEQLLTLINDLLDLSKIEAGRMDVHAEIFDVKHFVQACCETVTPLVKPTVQLRYEIADPVREAHTDEDGLRQIVLNLLSNAIRFTEVGEVVVRVSLEKQPTSEERLVITVADTGVGIAVEGLGRIFDEFEQLAGSHHQQKGTGLGLPIAKRWAELLGGSIAVESTIGKGSTFTVAVPIVYQQQRATPAESVAV